MQSHKETWAHNALRRSEELNRRILEAVPGGIVHVSSQGAIQYANQEAQAFLGLSYDELTSTYVSDFEAKTFHEDGSPCPVEEYPVARCLMTGQPQPAQTIGVLQPAGDIHWALFTAVPVLDPETQQLDGAVVTFLDITERRRMEQALRDKEEQLQLTLRATQVGIWNWDVTTNTVGSSESVATLFGLPLDAFGGTLEDVLALIYPEDRAGAEAVIQDALTGEAMDFRAELRVQHPDGSIHWLEGRAMIYRDEAGRPVRLAGTLLDITPQKHSAEALQRSEARYRTIFESTSDAMLIINRAGTVVEVNPATYQMHGYDSREAFLRLSPAEIVHPDDRALFKEFMDTVSQGMPFTGEGRDVCRDGSLIDVRVHGVSILYNGELHLLGVLRDITEQKRTEAALRRSEQRFRFLVEQSPFSTALFRPDGSISYVNPAFLALARLPADALDGVLRSYNMFEDPTFDDPATRALVRHGFSEGFSEGFASLPRTPLPLYGFEGPAAAPYEPSTIWVRGYIYPVIDGAGGVREVVVMYQDVTRQQAAEAQAAAAQASLLDQHQREKERVEVELQRTRADLVRQTRLATIGQVAASIAHELRNPLGAVRNASYYLQRQLPEAHDPRREYLEIIEQEVGAANQIISNLMEMSRAKEPVREPVDVEALLKHTLSHLRSADAVEVAWSGDPTPFVVVADRGQLRQVLGNVIENAIQATAAQGTIKVAARQEAGYDVIEVSDEGPGVPEALRPRIFEALFTTKAKGTGLGLPICRQIMTRHGGAIDLVPSAAPGATFRITLPRNTASPPETNGRTAVPPPEDDNGR